MERKGQYLTIKWEENWWGVVVISIWLGSGKLKFEESLLCHRAWWVTLNHLLSAKVRGSTCQPMRKNPEVETGYLHCHLCKNHLSPLLPLELLFLLSHTCSVQDTGAPVPPLTHMQCSGLLNYEKTAWVSTQLEHCQVNCQDQALWHFWYKKIQALK